MNSETALPIPYPHCLFPAFKKQKPRRSGAFAATSQGN
jgi:hypothetical protein